MLLFLTAKQGNNSIATLQKCLRVRIFGLCTVGNINRLSVIILLRTRFLAESDRLAESKGENNVSWKVVNFHFSRSGIVTVCVLITSTHAALCGSHSPSLSPSLSPHLSLHSQTAFAVQTLALRHCHTPHWLPWRNSPPGLQGTRVYCLWLLYLDENMICWKGSTCFFAASLCCLFFLLLPPHEHQCGVARCVLFHSSPFQEFDCTRVCVKLA